MREGVVVNVVPSQDVCDEDAVKFGGFELLGEGDPVFDGVEIGGVIVGVFPKAGGLVAGAWGLLGVISFHR